MSADAPVGLQLAPPARRAAHEPFAGPVDPVLAAVVVALVGFGVVMVYSASAVQATVAVPRPAVLPEAPGRVRRRSRSARCGLPAGSTTTGFTS